jgi:hypothetical protein
MNVAKIGSIAFALSASLVLLLGMSGKSETNRSVRGRILSDAELVDVRGAKRGPCLFDKMCASCWPFDGCAFNSEKYLTREFKCYDWPCFGTCTDTVAAGGCGGVTTGGNCTPLGISGLFVCIGGAPAGGVCGRGLCP